MEHVYALVLMLIYLSVMVIHAWTGKRATRGVTDYYVGGRRMGGVAIGLSFFATYASTNAFVGIAGQAYNYGVLWCLFGFFAVVFSMIAWRWVAPRLREFTEVLGSITIPDFIGFRFASTPARFVAALIVIGASILYLTAIFKGAGNLLAAALSLPYVMAVWIVFAVVVVYTFFGGFISVVKTDVVQGSIMLIAAIVLLWVVVDHAGGLMSISDAVKLSNQKDSIWTEQAISLPMMLGIFLATTMKLIVEPRQLSRFYALEDKRATEYGFWISTASILLIFLMLTPVGLYARLIFTDGAIDTDQIVPTLLANGEFMHPALAAFMMTVMLAAAMSSIDSVLLVTASSCERDIAGVISPPKTEAAALQATRVYVVVFALISVLCALDPPGSIVAITALSGSVYAACFFPALIFGLFWRKGNGCAVLASILTGLSVLIVLNLIELSGTMHPVFPALFSSLSVYIVIANLLPDTANVSVQGLFDDYEIQKTKL